MPAAQFTAFADELSKLAAGVGTNPAGAVAGSRKIMSSIGGKAALTGATPPITQVAKSLSPATITPPNISA